MDTTKLETLLSISYQLAQERKLNGLLSQAMRVALDLTGAEYGFLVLHGEREAVEFRLGLDREGNSLTESLEQISQTIYRKVVSSGEPALIADALTSVATESTQTLQIRSVICVPLIASGRVLGALYVENRSEADPFSPDDLKLMEYFAAQVAISIENASLNEELESRVEARTAELTQTSDLLQIQIAEKEKIQSALDNRVQILGTLNLVMLELANRRDIDGILQTVLAKLGSLLEAPDVSVDLLEGDDTIITFAATPGQPLKVGDTMRRGEGGFLSWQAVETGLPSILEDYTRWAKRRDLYEGFPIHAIMVVPLKHKNRVVGTINCSRRTPGRPFSDTDVYIAEQLAQIAALVLDNAQVYAQLQNELKERRQAEEALKRSEEKFIKAFHASPDAITISRLGDGAWVEVNEGFSQITGYSREEALSSSSTETGIWVHPEERDAFAETLQEHGRILEQEYEFRAKSGKIFNGVISGEIILLDGIEHVLAVTRDVTDKKRAAEALQQSEERFRQLVMSGPDAVFGVTMDGKIVFANVAATLLLGFTNNELVGREMDGLIPARLRQYHAYQRDQYVHKPRTRPLRSAMESVAVDKGGNEIPVDIKLSHIETSSGILVITYMRDISERKHSEKQLLEAQAQLVDHQRNLAKIEERRRMGRDLHDSVNQSINSLVLLADTLTSTLERQHYDRSAQVADRLQESARQALKETWLLLYELQAPGPGRSVDLPRDLEARLATVERRAGIRSQVILDGDIELCPQAWHENLFWIAIEALNNSLKHAQARSLQILLRPAPQRMEMEIADDGKGFDPLRLHLGGMGLTNMRERASLLGGTLDILSSPGQGTRVVFSAEIK
ncbi:MAG: PAS domain S-box protein [Chloroflexota bacterium]